MTKNKTFIIKLFIEAVHMVLDLTANTLDDAKAIARGGELAGYMAFVYDSEGTMVI